MGLGIITAELIERARIHGACSSGLPDVGDSVYELRQSQLIWIEQSEMCDASDLAELGIGAPLFAISSDGDGSGYGYGSGCGDGSGDGYGDGSGYGSGSGDGYGDGYGYGSGCGCGDGSGYGSG